MKTSMGPSVYASRWLWIALIGLGLAVVAVICVLLITHNPASLDSTALEPSEPSVVVPASSSTIEPAVTVANEPLQLPRLDFASGSVEEACGLNEFPPYSMFFVDRRKFIKTSDHAQVLESDQCQAALEAYMNAMNPQWFLSSVPYEASLAELVVLDEPFTFERIFADPSGDLLRVQDALSRPECLLTGDETNWELKETCHANALLNYAFVSLFCYGQGVIYRERPVDGRKDYRLPYRKMHPTPEEDRTLWKQDLEDEWVEDKCETFSPTLELTSEHHPELYALVESLLNRRVIHNAPQVLLVELAARLGDDAAALSESVLGPGDWSFMVQGSKFGRINKLVGNGEWRGFALKEEPNADRFLEAFYMLARLDSPKSVSRDEIEFNWEFVARYLCEPPYFEYQPLVSLSSPQLVENGEHSSCKEIVHEIRQKGITFPPLVKMLDKFEQVALELGVYE